MKTNKLTVGKESGARCGTKSRFRLTFNTKVTADIFYDSSLGEAFTDDSREMNALKSTNHLRKASSAVLAGGVEVCGAAIARDKIADMAGA